MKIIALFGTLAFVMSLGQVPAQGQYGRSAPTVNIRTGALRGSLSSSGVAAFKNIPVCAAADREPALARAAAGRALGRHARRDGLRAGVHADG